MNPVEYFFWLAREALLVPVLIPWFSLAALVALVAALTVGLSRYELFFRRQTVLLLSPLAIPVMILLCGTAFVYGGPIGTAPVWPQWLIGALLFSHLPIAVLFVRRFRGLRWTVVGLSLFECWVSLCAAAMSVMSVTNDWL